MKAAIHNAQNIIGINACFISNTPSNNIPHINGNIHFTTDEFIFIVIF